MAQIPPGRVATYGQIARIAGLPGRARLVGRVMAATSDAIPWHRVLGAAGRVSDRGQPDVEALQRERLEQEGVAFDQRGRVDLDQFGWDPQ